MVSRFAAFLLAAVALALNVAASAEIFEPPGALGYRLTYTDGFRVAAVDAGSAAARAGIAAGDRLDVSRSKLHDRIVALEYRPPLAGESVSFAVIRPGRPAPLDVTLRAGTPTRDEARQAQFSPLTSLLHLTGFAYIGVALFILLRRPNRMTWGLFLYLISAANASQHRFPDALFPLAQFASDVIDIAGPIGLLIFAARFPHDEALGWEAWIDRLAIPIGAVFAVPNIAWDATSLLAGRSPAPWMSLGSTAGALGLILASGATLVASYFGDPPAERRRLQWAILGVLFTLPSYASEWGRYWSTTYLVATSEALVWIATILYACAPFALAYAVVRSRVFEVSFVIGRTLIYTILTGTIFAFFALVEWLAGRLLEGTGVTMALVALSAIGVAFSLEFLYAKVELFVERVLFRRRHLAERHLERVAERLQSAPSRERVEEALLHEPVRAYALTSAALFVRDGSGELSRGGEALDRGVAAKLDGARRSVRLEGDPVLAVPVYVRARLEAVALYGAHVNGEDIAPDEAASLEAIGAAAGLAYDHLEAARIRDEATRWRRLAQEQARELAALRERLGLLGEHLARDDANGDRPA